jgi:hypothetical protein
MTFRHRDNASMPDVMSSVYIPCDVRPGLFSTEYTVTVRDLSGEVTSFFADRQLVKEGQRPLLCVNYLGASESRDAAITVLLPASAMDAGLRYLDVPEGDIVGA